MDHAKQIRDLLPEIDAIQDSTLADAVVDIWVDFWQSSTWDRLEDVPKNPKSLKGRGLVPHVRSVTQQSIAAGRIVQELHHIAIDFNLLVAGALLHDVSKLAEYELGPGGEGRQSREGKLIQHGALGASKALERGLPIELVHLILSHTKASNHAPMTMEGIILHYVDYLDSDVLLLDAEQPLLMGR